MGKKAIYMTAVAGLGLAVFLVATAGFREILHILATAGWSLLWLAPYHLLPVILDSAGWRLLLRSRAPQVPFPYLVWAAAVRDAANSLLPLVGPAGAVAGIRLLVVRKVSGTFAAASVIVEGTVTLISQLLFVLSGIALYVVHPAGGDTPLLNVLAPVLLAALPFIVLVLVLQGKPWLFHWMEPVMDRLAERLNLPGLVGSPTRLHGQLKLLYGQPSVVLRAGLWQLAGLFAGVGEVWLALYLFDQPVSIGTAVLLQSLGQAVRTAAFMVPGGIGVQEAGFMLFAHLVGLGPHVGLALALAKRLRELVFGLPLLASWQWFEGRRLILHRTAEKDA
ncbi:MAG: lysylphosphatidylglycerol synthase domain-containing protein [Chromatiaceae bacterium]